MEYGGNKPPFDNTKWREQIIRDEQYFNRLEAYSIITKFESSQSNGKQSKKTKDGSIETNKEIIQNIDWHLIGWNSIQFVSPQQSCTIYFYMSNVITFRSAINFSQCNCELWLGEASATWFCIDGACAPLDLRLCVICRAQTEVPPNMLQFYVVHCLHDNKFKFL